MTCPNINTKEYKLLKEVYGGLQANILYHRNNDNIPSIEESIKLFYPQVEVSHNIKAWDTGTMSGKDQKEFEPKIDALILKDPNDKVGGGESFNEVKTRVIDEVKRIIDTAPDKSAVITHSTVLKFLKLWDELGRPDNLDEITAEKYLDQSTKPAEVEKIKTDKGDIAFIRHGETEDNEDGKLRTSDTMLTDKGVKQADKIGEQLKDTEISNVYTSPLPRAIHTTDRILSNQSEKENNQQFQLSSSDKQIDNQLNQLLGQFVNILKGKINNVQEIVINGIKYDAVAVTDILNKVISVVDGKAGLDTLSEEVGHLFVEYLPEDSSLLNQMMKDIITRPMYDDVMQEYSDNEHYQNEDGTVNTDKIAKEAIGKMIAQAITNNWENQKEKNIWSKLWDKLWNWIKNIINIFKEKQAENPYEEIASDIMNNDISKLDMDKFQKTGEYYFQQTQEEKAYDKWVMSDGSPHTDTQRETYQAIHVDNHNRLVLDTENDKHEYRKIDPATGDTIKYTSNTTAINGVKNIPDDGYSKDRGNDADLILRDIIIGKTWEEIRDNTPMKQLSDNVKKEVYDSISNSLSNYISTDVDGNKDLAAVQSILTYEPDVNGVQRYLAASSDLIIIAPDGSIKKIIDLKTSKEPINNSTNPYEVGKGSWLPNGTKLTKMEGYNLQLTNEQLMLQMAHPGIRIANDALEIINVVWKINPKDASDLLGVKTIKQPTISITEPDFARSVLMTNMTMVPQGPKLSMFDEPTLEGYEDALNAMTPEDKEEFLAKKEKRDKGLDEILDNLDKLFSTRSKSLLPEFGYSIQNAFKKIVGDVAELRTNEDRIAAILKYINTIQRFTDSYSKYIKDSDNFKDSSYYQILQETIKMAESHLENIPENLRDLLKPEQLVSYDQLRKSILQLREDYVLFARRYVNEEVASKFSIKPIMGKDKDGKIVEIKSIQQQLQDILWSPENDISMTSMMGDAIREMTVQLLGQMSLIVDRANLEATINGNKIIDDINTLGQVFEKNTGLKFTDKSASDFLFQLNDKGERQRWLDKIGEEYYDLKRVADSLMLDPSTGLKREFILDAKDSVETDWNEQVGDKVVTTKIFQTEFNKRLDELRKQRREFYDPESFIDEEDDQGNSLPRTFFRHGNYHSLSEKYFNERKRVMRFVQKGSRGEWVERKGVVKSATDDFTKWTEKSSNVELLKGKSEQDKWNMYWKSELKEFRDKYQVWTEYLSMEKTLQETDEIDENGKVIKEFLPTGKMIKMSGYFPNSQSIEINENKMVYDGTDMVPEKSMQSKQYNDLKNDKSTLGKERWTFYNSYMEKLAEYVKKGGDKCESWFKKGGLINLPAKFLKTAADVDGGTNSLGLFAQEHFTAIPDASSKYTDDFGVPRQELLIPHMANVRNTQEIKNIMDELTKLETDRFAKNQDGSPKVKLEDYLKQKRTLDAKLKAENHKTDVNDLEHDPVKLLATFGVGVEKFAQLSAVEGQVLAIRDIIRQDITNEDGTVKQFNALNNIGQRVTKVGSNGKEFVFRRKDETNTLKKVEDYLKMFYGESHTKTQLDVIADRIMNITSFGAMGFNYMGHFKNAILYQASNFRQNIAERYVTRKNYTSSQLEFFKDFLPGMQTKLFEKKSGPFKAKSKMEWMMHTFGLDADAQLKAQGKLGAKWMDKFYLGETFAIHWAQYTMQAAYMKDQLLKDSSGKEIKDKNGNSISMYNAYQWDANLGKCVLIPEAKETLEEQKNIILRAKDIQTKTQGNFEESNKPMLKNYLLGRMFSQFHNYFKTAWNDRFDQKYTHASLGEMEGTWRTIVSYCQGLKEFEGHWSSNLKNGWNSLSEHQQKNLKTDLAEIIMVCSFLTVGGIIATAAKNVSANDDKKKKFLNLLAYTAKTVGKEQGSMDPIFGLFSIKDFIENPLAVTPVIKGVTAALLATAQFPFQDDIHRHYQRGVFKGNTKVWEEWAKILPILKQLHRWANFEEMNDPDYTR